MQGWPIFFHGIHMLHEEEEEMNLIHMIHTRNYDKNNAYTIMRLNILYNTTGNIIIFMVIVR